MTTTDPQGYGRERNAENHQRKMDALQERATEQYTAAVREARYGYTPAARAAAKARAQQLRGLVHGR
jgi:predicted component of type VI protein secretion system